MSESGELGVEMHQPPDVGTTQEMTGPVTTVSQPDGAGLRVAIVGAGPSGLYAARSLLKSSFDISVDVFDRLPTPYGLVRYGVAPDNQKMKSVIRVLEGSFDERHAVRFFGNVVFGQDLTRAELRDHYDAVVYATGTQGDRLLGLPDEDLSGSYGAKEFVNWYNAHPDAADREFPLHGSQVAVIGAGNVALDVVRMLVKSIDEVASTDVPDRVLEALRASQVTDVYLLARRGPAQAKFTPPELREMGELANADVVIDPAELVLSDEDEQRMDSDKQLRTNIMLLREWAQRPPQGKPRRVHMRFLHSPVQILGTKGVTGLVLERNQLRDDGSVYSTGEYETLDVQMLLRAVGYQAHPLPEVPFDQHDAVVPNNAGRVFDTHGRRQVGEYVTGWARRGPTGVIGTNKNDASEIVRNLLDDMAGRMCTESRHPNRILELLEQRNVNYVDWAGWLRLDSHETRLGERAGRPRVKVPKHASMLRIARQTPEQ